MVTIHLENDPEQKERLPRVTRGSSIIRDKRTDAPGVKFYTIMGLALSPNPEILVLIQ